MISGQQAAEANYQRFIVWINSKSDEDFKQYVFRGQLSRTEIAKECEFGISAIRQNPRIKETLEVVENRLRTMGVLPDIAQTELGNVSSTPSLTRAQDERIKRLEQDKAILQAKVDCLEKYIKRYGAMENFISDTLRMPR